MSNDSISRPPLELAVYMALCEGEADIATDTLDSLLSQYDGGHVDVFLVDDASPSRAGEEVAQRVAGRCRSVQVRRMPSSLGYFGCLYRALTGLQMVAESPRRYDRVVHVDPDMLLVNPDAMNVILAQTGRRGMWGLRLTMRPVFRLQFLSDLSPIGLRRRMRDGQLLKQRELRLNGPAWWWRMALRGLIRGFRFRFCSGPFCVIGGDTFHDWVQRGYLGYDLSRRGCSCEDDVMIGVMTHAVGDRVQDIQERLAPYKFGVVSIWPALSADQVMEERMLVVHPLRARGESLELRRQLIERMPWLRRSTRQTAMA